MTPQREADLNAERDRLFDKLHRMQRMIAGSLVRGQKRCGRAACRCTQGQLHRHVVISGRSAGRTRITYVSLANDDAAAEAVAEYRQVVQILEQITAANIELLKAGKLLASPR